MAGFLGVEERERERTDPVLGGKVNRLAAAARNPYRRMRPLQRLGHDVARRHAHVLSDMAGERRLGHAAQRDAHAFLPHRPLVGRVDAERVELRRGRALAGAELDASVREDVEGRDPLRHPSRMVDRRKGVDDAVSEADPLGALRRGGEEQLRGARVRVLLEEVVLDDPHAVDPDPVGELDLLEGFVNDPPLVAVVPRAGAPGVRRTVRTSSRASHDRRLRHRHHEVTLGRNG